MKKMTVEEMIHGMKEEIAEYAKQLEALDERDTELCMDARKLFFEGKYESAEMDEINKETIKVHRLMREINDKILVLNKKSINVGDGVTRCLYSDREAYTVIKRTASTVTVQRDKATLKMGWKPEWDGMYCTNNSEQEWDYERNENGSIETFRWSDKQEAFVNGDIRLAVGRHEFYDYNF